MTQSATLSVQECKTAHKRLLHVLFERNWLGFFTPESGQFFLEDPQWVNPLHCILARCGFNLTDLPERRYWFIHERTRQEVGFFSETELLAYLIEWHREREAG